MIADINLIMLHNMARATLKKIYDKHYRSMKAYILEYRNLHGKTPLFKFV